MQLALLFALLAADITPVAKQPDLKQQYELQVLLTDQAKAEAELIRLNVAMREISTRIAAKQAEMQKACGDKPLVNDPKTRTWVCGGKE